MNQNNFPPRLAIEDHTRPTLPTLVELTARCVASHIPFELVENVYPPVPEQLQLRIAFWSFPDNEEDIRLYSCLANGSADEFQKGEHIFKNKLIKDPLQIGFHLSATVVIQLNLSQIKNQYNVAVTFDRRRITSCNCTCSSSAYWCAHIVAVCLYRIHMPTQVCLRAPVSESLSRLHREQLQKFAQYLISELPQQILPTAQRLLDELLSCQPSSINTVCGAPDPTAGASANELTSWYLDEKTLHENIKKILIKFCVPAPIVFSDVNYLSNTAPPAAAEWTSLLRPLRGREPEGMWNLLSIVREMFKRNDRNAVPLLEIITEESMACEQILVWWFNTKVALHNGNSGHGGGKHTNVNSNSHASQHACSSLCDEIVILWRLAALNPGLAPDERKSFTKQFKNWHMKIVEKVMRSRSGGNSSSPMICGSNNTKTPGSFKNDIEGFTGFKPAIEACFLDWQDYPIPGITYTEGINPLYHRPFTCFRHAEPSRPDNVNQVNSSQAVLNCEHPKPHHSSRSRSHQHKSGFHGSHKVNKRTTRTNKNLAELTFTGCHRANREELSLCAVQSNMEHDGNRSSVSSEGFCENEADGDTLNDSNTVGNEVCDTDSQGGRSESSSSGPSTIQKDSQRNGDSVHKANSEIVSEGSPVFSPETQSDDSDISIERKLSEIHIDFDLPANSIPTVDNFQYFSNFSCSVQPEALTSTPKSASCSSSCKEAQKTPVSGSSGELDKTIAVYEISNAPQSKIELGESCPSKDESSSNSDCQPQPGENEYNLYYYDPKELVTEPNNSEKLAVSQKGTENTPQNTIPASLVFSNLRKTEDPYDILFARAEGLHAHGHGREACTLGIRLAEELLVHPPDLMVELPSFQPKGKRKKVNPASHQVSCVASATLAKCAFLCTVLAENVEHYHLAFKVGLFGLEMARPPASTKPLEVKLANQESELVCLLKRIPLGSSEMKILRDRAQQLRDGTLRSKGEALLPIMLASFIFDALAVPTGAGNTRCNFLLPVCRLPGDETLGFEAAVAALGLKANVSEADHPLLCEGTRRQRGDLAITLLVFYKDNTTRIAQIMEKLLDRDVHQLIKTPILSSHYSPCISPANSCGRRLEESCNGELALVPVSNAYSSTPDVLSVDNSSVSGPGSRPHSSPSAEMDQTLQSMPITTTNQPNSSRNKDSRFKKRAYPSIPNQPSEAGAHFMFELAKTVLTKAGGNSSTSLFTQASTSQNHHGPHRTLHICAFQIGLYALGLHNCVSPNWLSRTYSSHVSWITGQAMDIGAPAISFLINTWEGHLTPPEAVSIADRASRGCDPNMVKAAAELALSCLPHSHALNPNEITRAILQCKEQSDAMLEHACHTVENTAKGGGVYPEVLFQVARHWYELYSRHTPLGEQLIECELPHEAMPLDSAGTLMALVETASGTIDLSSGLPPPQPTLQGALSTATGAQSMVVTSTPPPYAQHPAITLAPLGVNMSMPYSMPYNFAMQGLHPHPHHPQFGGPLSPHPHTISLPPPPHVQMYISPPAFQYPPHASNQPQAAYSSISASAGPGISYHGTIPPPSTTPLGSVATSHHVYALSQGGAIQMSNSGVGQNQIAVLNASGTQPQVQKTIPPHGLSQGIIAPVSQVTGLPNQSGRNQQQIHRAQYNQGNVKYLLSAYRVGMLGLETLARRVHDDRPQAKYARTPPYGEDVKWLLRISKKLGTQYLQQFCICAVNSIVSPFVLHDIAIEAAHYLARNNPSLVMQHLRSALTPLVQKCQQMYIQCMHQKLYHLTAADYEDFVNVVCSARAAFNITPEGTAQFKEWLQSIRRSKSCKKDLWTQINTALQLNSK